MRVNSNPSRSCTGTCEDTPSGIVVSVASCAETVNVPAALSVTVYVPTPDCSWAGPGSVALASDDWISMELPTLVTVFQLRSQARTGMLNETPVTCGTGAPVRPELVPGAGFSPGSSTWSLEYGPCAAAGAANSAAATMAIHERTMLSRVTARTASVLVAWASDCAHGSTSRRAMRATGSSSSRFRRDQEACQPSGSKRSTGCVPHESD